MDHSRNSLRVGAAVIAAAVMLRLLSGGVLDNLILALTKPETVAVLMYLETGRVVRPYTEMTYPAESPIPDPPPPPTAPVTPSFSSRDLELVDIKYGCDYDPDLENLLLQPLDWDLTENAPKVLILHTHTTESYTRQPEEIYEETADYRTLDEKYNMISIGAYVAARLEEAGIGVIHDRTLHDYPSYNGSYLHARESISQILSENPSISMVLDLHRDAAEMDTGQMDTSATVNGEESAQLMFVVGTDAGGLEHPAWQENLSLSLKLHALLQRGNPGVCRPISLRSERFNADVSPGALLIEVGAAGNTHDEALLAAQALADSIIALAYGANLTADSTS